ncbi:MULTISPECIES: ACP S-malonyltransferase [unclassified Minwuia]|jgi:[acyl-carrier-protein] S-malonyltransferase|uniref:ACP S-malonyltransferase n=1 Tax=unclassified Minwuia TaxID=2618799 RepID=UPI002478D33A|nr:MULTISPECIES: ACP S-malonyltransferase [unclassified Minwuia]
MARALVFPGQGSQAVGMGVALAEASAAAREVFEEVDDAISQPLFRLMKEGPEGDLVLTENAQPALMAVSMAVMRVMEREGGFDLARSARFVAGHSLGEYSALAAAGSIGLSDTARLLKLRGQAMQRAVPVGQGAMAALLGLSLEDAAAVAEAAAQGEVCRAANDNAEGQVVVSGSSAAIDRAVEIAREKGAKKAMRLQVSAPFHCPLMQPAADEMAEALGNVTISAPKVPLIANVTASAVDDPERIRALLVQQVTSMVRWRESVLYMRDNGIGELAEIGSGKVLATMTRRIDRSVSARAVNTPDDIEAFLGTL